MRLLNLLFLVLVFIPLKAQVKTDSSKNEQSSPIYNQKTDTARIPKEAIEKKDEHESETRGEYRRSYVRRKGAGYRIQIFTGGNSRSDRMRANRMGGICRSYFPELSVYTHFESPRWICRVGDFKTLEDARIYVRKMRKLKAFKELRIVRSVVWQYW